VEGSRIKVVRRRVGLCRQRFVQLLSVSLQTVRRWESGVTRPLPIISRRLRELRRETATSRPRVASIPKRGGIPMSGGRGRERTGVQPSLGGLSNGMGSLVDLLAKMEAEGAEEYSRSGEVKRLRGKVKGVYGFSIQMGLGRKPVIQRFGNIQETVSGPAIAETGEPLVDVLEEERQVVVIAEMPGVEARDIQVRLEGDILELSVATGQRRYAKEVLLPTPGEPGGLKSSYRNGILEVRVRKQMRHREARARDAES
jgi:HSP20 family protein